MLTLPRRRPPFFWLVVALGCATVLAQVVGSVWMVRYARVRKTLGFRSSLENGSWVVSRVDPDGPAAGKLVPGDRLRALDGDTRVAVVGPLFKLRELQPGAACELAVERAGEARAVHLELPPGERGPGERGYLYLLKLLAFAFLATSLVIGVLKPEDPIARWGFLSLFLASLTLLNSATGPLFAAMHGGDAAIYLLIPVPNPLHLAVAFGFYSRFPAGVPRARLAVLGGRLLLLVGGALWVSEEIVKQVVARPLADGPLAAALPALVSFDRLDAPFTLLGFVAILAVIARRMRLVAEPDQVRRMHWIAYGSLAGLSPWLVYEALSLALASTPQAAGFLAVMNRFANLALVIVPVVTAFAIVKHRLFDINVVVRRGLQYLLARNVLAVATGVAVVALVVTVWENRHRTLAGIFENGVDRFYLLVGGVALLLSRKRLNAWLDRVFFREAFDREKVLVGLSREIAKLESFSEMSRHVSHELAQALHPTSIHVFMRDTERSSQVLVFSSSSGELTPSLRIADDAVLLRVMEADERPHDFPFPEGTLPDVEHRWLESLGVSLVVPMCGSDERLAGLLFLGEKRSEEPYSQSDRKVLTAIAGQMALAYENSQLKGQVQKGEQFKREVLSRFEETGRFVKECPKCGACFGGTGTLTCPADGTELVVALPVEQTLVSRYRLEKLIGRGGMGAVYEARDLRLDRSVAVKILVGQRFVHRAAVKRFEREARTTAKLNHPNIVSTYDYGTIEGEAAFLVMELVRGTTLRTEIRQTGRLPPAVVAGYFEQILEGMKAAHASGVIHRDLKAENILLQKKPERSPGGSSVELPRRPVVKIADFGLAKMTLLDTAGSDSLTLPGTAIGTVGYMAPEQIQGSATDERTDVFALGVLAAEMLVGRLPFRGSSASETMMATLNQPFHLAGSEPEVMRLDAVLQKCLAKEPAGRYRSIAEMADELLPALRRCPLLTPSTTGKESEPEDRPTDAEGRETPTRNLR